MALCKVELIMYQCFWCWEFIDIFSTTFLRSAAPPTHRQTDRQTNLIARQSWFSCTLIHNKIHFPEVIKRTLPCVGSITGWSDFINAQQVNLIHFVKAADSYMYYTVEYLFPCSIFHQCVNVSFCPVMLRASLAVSCQYLFGPKANTLCMLNWAQEPELLEKPIVARSLKNNPHSMELEGSLPYSQETPPLARWIQSVPPHPISPPTYV
jgi:hypothetical protein